MNIFTRNMDFVKYNGQEMDWVKFNGNIVFENWKILEKYGIVPMILPKCKASNLLEYSMKGSTVQGVPSQYQVVDYIQSNGNQYIDTGITGTNNTSIEVDFASVGSVSANSNVAIVGSWFNTPYSLRYSDSAVYFYYGSDQTDGGTGQAVTVSTSRHTIKTNKNELYFDGTLKHTYNANTFETEKPITIFGQNGGASVARKSSIKLYRLKIYDGDILIRDYIPCYRKSNNEIGLYDVVNREFKINDGTGNFTKGSDTTLTISFDKPVEYQSVGDLVTDTQDVNYGKYKIPVVVKDTALPSEYQEVEYIESTGTQYINTGVVGATTNMAYEIKFQKTGYWLIGAVSIAGSSGDSAISANQIRFGTQYVTNLNLNEDAHTIYVDKEKYTIDGTTTNWDSTSTLTGNKNIYLFWANGSSIDKNGKIYYCNIYDNNTLVRCFVPCYRKSDNEIGMYDLVNNKFYTNAGTGNFVKGNNVGNGTPYSTTNIYLNEPLRKLVRDSSTQFIDYIDFENNKVIRNTREVVVTGNENWETISSGTPKMFRYKLSNQKIGPETQSSFPDQFCNYANAAVVTVGGGEIGASAYYSSSVSGGGTIFRIRPTTNYATVATFTSMLKDLYNAGTPLKYVIPIYNATEESITLPNIPLVRGKNVIDTNTIVKPYQIYVKYKGR